MGSILPYGWQEEAEAWKGKFEWSEQAKELAIDLLEIMEKRNWNKIDASVVLDVPLSMAISILKGDIEPTEEIKNKINSLK